MSGINNYNDLSAFILIASVLFCAYIMVKPFLKVSIPVLLFECLVFSCASILNLPAIHRFTILQDNRGLLFFFALYFPIFYFSLDLSITRSLCIYLWAINLLLFPSNISCLIDSMIHKNHLYMDFGYDAIIIQFVMNAALCILAYLVLSRWDINVLSPSGTPESLWVGWLSVPILFLGLNIALLPNDYRMLNGYHLHGTYLFFSGSLFVLYGYLTSIFYSHMQEYIHIREYKEAQRISDIQSLQYKSLLSQIEADRHARHDFKHTLNLLSQLAREEDAEALRDYIRQYTKESSGIIVKNYCSNPAINAVLNYYETKSEEEGIISTIQVDLPVPLPLSDPEFCSLIGNIMENAIEAAKYSPAPVRRFSISIRIQNDSTLYIVSSNDYDGELFIDSTNNNAIFSQKKEKNHGIGLQSIKETVDKYHGILRISAKDMEFHVDIAIPI